LFAFLQQYPAQDSAFGVELARHNPVLEDCILSPLECGSDGIRVGIVLAPASIVLIASTNSNSRPANGLLHMELTKAAGFRSRLPIQAKATRIA
jgi:hypothetical protein